MLFTNNFIFIHVPKTAGTSIQNALGPQTSIRYRSTLHKNCDRRFSDHITIARLAARAGEVPLKARFVFAFVRNPWERAQSLYHHIIQHGQNRKWEQEIPRYQQQGLNDWIVNDMEKWIVYATSWHHNGNIYQQSSWIAGYNMDFIGRYENLQNDFNHVCKILNIQCKLPHALKTQHEHYSKEYTDTGREKIAQLFARDIKRFDYGF